ncbi:MAG: histidine phosphatase family protein [Alphaproteobacteria bacterium]
MRRLLLLRHAKSSWDQDDLDDMSRPLAPRGRRAAPVIGRYMSGRDLLPDLVLCSTAERARQTLELVTAEWEREAGAAPKVTMRVSLYLASAGELFASVQRLDDDVESVMIVGHNPGLATFAGNLVTNGDPLGMRAMAAKFPTAALAVVDLDLRSWNEVAPGCGYLSSFVRPKDLK